MLVDRAAPLALAAGEYSGSLRDLAHALKYRRVLAAAGVGAELIVAAAPADVLRGALVPVPPAPRRWRWRGFDPAEELAVAIADRTGLPLRPCLRRADGPRQVGRSRRLRLSDPPRVRCMARPPHRAVLVDDVLTTGATLAACERSLRAAGAAEVTAVALAAARRPRALEKEEGGA